MVPVERAMAKLENLKQFDIEIDMAMNDIEKWQRGMALEAKTWTLKQQVQLSVLIGAVLHLANAVAELVDNNR